MPNSLDDLDGPDEGDGPETMFDTAADWVQEWLCPTLSARIAAERKWCPQWWRHPAVAVRLDTLWSGWEGARINPDPLAMSSWWVYHFDAHWRAITASDGPMYLCRPERHTDTDPLPFIPAPDGWFDPSPPPTDVDPDDEPVTDLDT